MKLDKELKDWMEKFAKLIEDDKKRKIIKEYIEEQKQEKQK